MANPNVLVLKADGINCDEETAHAFNVAGADTEIVHVNQLLSREKSLGNYAILALSGGFSYGDAIASGKVLAAELTTQLSDDLRAFAEAKKPIIGICNGFQVLVRSGLLADRTVGEQTATLTDNENGRFECRWVNLGAEDTVCEFVGPDDFPEPLPIHSAHAEGRFKTTPQKLAELNANRQVVFRYVAPDGSEALRYPDSPNGSVQGIAGITDPGGTILGMMPHPERSVAGFHPNHRLRPRARDYANVLFRNIVRYAQ